MKPSFSTPYNDRFPHKHALILNYRARKSLSFIKKNPSYGIRATRTRTAIESQVYLSIYTPRERPRVSRSNSQRIYIHSRSWMERVNELRHSFPSSIYKYHHVLNGMQMEKRERERVYVLLEAAREIREGKVGESVYRYCCVDERRNFLILCNLNFRFYVLCCSRVGFVFFLYKYFRRSFLRDAAVIMEMSFSPYLPLAALSRDLNCYILHWLSKEAKDSHLHCEILSADRYFRKLPHA